MNIKAIEVWKITKNTSEKCMYSIEVYLRTFTISCHGKFADKTLFFKMNDCQHKMASNLPSLLCLDWDPSDGSTSVVRWLLTFALPKAKPHWSLMRELALFSGLAHKVVYLLLQVSPTKLLITWWWSSIVRVHISYHSFYIPFLSFSRPPLWSNGQSFRLQIQRSRVRFPALSDFLRSGTGVTQPSEDNWEAIWMNKERFPPQRDACDCGSVLSPYRW
jgi:hypothetical protein